jgi:hypothetical protein
MSTQYYYELPDGSMDGPVEMDALVRDLADGMLTEETKVSRGGDDPWATLREVMGRDMRKRENRPEKLPLPNAVERPATPEPAVPSKELVTPRFRGTISELLDIFAALQMIAGILFAGFGLISWSDDSGVAFVRLVAGLSALVSGVFCMAAAEVLVRLREIRDALYRR